MADPTPTSHYAIQKPVPNQVYTETDNWGTRINSGLDIIDAQMYAEEVYGSGIGAIAISDQATVVTHTSQISTITAYASGVNNKANTNSTNITSAINYASGIAAKVYPYFSPNVEYPPFHSIRFEYSSGLGAQSGLTVSEGFDGTNTFVSASSNQGYQEHLDMYFTKRFPPHASFGANTIDLNFDADSTDSSTNKIMTTVFKNGVGETQETFTYSVDQSYTTSLNTGVKHAWHMESATVTDSVGSFTMVNQGAVESSSGIYNHCLDFENSEGDYLYNNYPYPSNYLIPNTGSFTFTICVKPESDVGLGTTRDIAYKQLAPIGAPVIDPTWAISIIRSGSDRLFGYTLCSDSGPTTCYAGPASDISGKWWMIVIRFDADTSTVKLDVCDLAANTTYSASDTTMSAVQLGASDFIIGAQYAWDFEYNRSVSTGAAFDGLIDEAVFWDSYKSDSDVVDLINSGHARFYGAAVPSTKLTNIGTGWTSGDTLVLKTEMYTKNNSAIRLYDVDFDLE